MSICDSEENRKKLAWLVPGYILLAWFFCVLFQPLGIRSPNSRYHPRLTKYGEQIIYLTSDDANTQHCRNNGSVITLEMGQRSAVVIRLGRIQHHMEPFLCSLRIKKGNSLDGISAYVEEIDLPEYHDDTRKPGGHWGSFVCHDFIKLWTGEPEDGENAKKLCGRWSAFDHEGHGTGALETVPLKAMVDSCQDDGVCHQEIFVHIEMDGGIIVADGHGPHIGLSLRQRKDFVMVFTGYKNTVATPSVVSVPQTSEMPTTTQTTDTPETEVTNETSSTNNFGGKENSGNRGGIIRGQHQKNASVLITCGKEEHKCHQSDYDIHRHQTSISGMNSASTFQMPSRCIWSKLRCDYHQNCGRGHESDETGCGYLRRVSGIHERLSPWSVSTMSLLIIVYLAIVLILVLVTMLLLRWHKVLRTPLDVLSDSRVHQSPPMVMEDRELAAAAAAASSTVTPATVSIMVMYRPHKPRGLSQPSTVELPPSYESLFMGDSPPSYNIAANDAENDPRDPDPEAAGVTTPSVMAPGHPNVGQNHSVDLVAANAIDEDIDDTTNAAIEVDSHCDCDCDHSLCNASVEDQDFVQDK